MKASELKRYNFVFYKDKVMQIQTNYELFKACIDCDRGINIEPIPLTEEWLLKFGFIKDESKLDPPNTPYGNFWADWVLNGIEIQMPYFEFVFNDGQNSIDIKYVHQLQNLYHALTGQELKIKTDE